jgi:hypothetical protein
LAFLGELGSVQWFLESAKPNVLKKPVTLSPRADRRKRPYSMNYKSLLMRASIGDYADF